MLHSKHDTVLKGKYIHYNIERLVAAIHSLISIRIHCFSVRIWQLGLDYAFWANLLQLMGASEEPGRCRANMGGSVEVGDSWETQSKSLEAVLPAVNTGVSRFLPGPVEEELRWD